MYSRFFIFLCLLFMIIILVSISYSIQLHTVKKNIQESFLFSKFTKCSEATNLAPPTSMDSKLMIQKTEGNLPISQYHVFSSWNTACSGKFVSTQQILNVLSTGCRFLDFPITNINGEPMICSPQFTNDVSDNFISLNTAIKTVVENAFQNYITINYNCNNKTNTNNKFNSQKYTLKNSQDPLFIQLRFPKIDKEKIENDGEKNIISPITNEYLNKVAEYVGYAIKGLQYQNASLTYKLTPDTTLQKLVKSVILLVDMTSISNAMFEDSELSNIANIVVGESSGMMMYPFQVLLKATPKNIPSIQNPNPSSNFSFNMAIPDSKYNIEPSIEQVMELAAYHNVQFVPFLFYRSSALLSDYIRFFQKKQTAFLSIKSLTKYLLQDSEQAVMR